MYCSNEKRIFTTKSKKLINKMTAEIFNLMQEAISKGKGDKVKERMSDYIMTKVQKEKLTKSLSS